MIWFNTASCNGVVNHGAQIGVFRFLPTTHVKTDAKQMRPRSLHAVPHFMHVYLPAQTAVDAGDIHTWQTMVILITGKTWRHPIWALCWDQNGPGSGISLVYLWIHPKSYISNSLLDDTRLSFFFPVIFNIQISSFSFSKKMNSYPNKSSIRSVVLEITLLIWSNIFKFQLSYTRIASSM